MLLAAALAVSAGAAPPEGPRLAVLKVTLNPAGSELETLDAAGGGYRQVLGASPRAGLRFDALSVPAWSPDGALLAFSHRDRKHLVISTAPSGGGAPQLVPGTTGGLLPVFSPDGRSLAFTRIRREVRASHFYESTAVWLVDLDTGERRQLTRWRDELEQYASSFSPDGSTLLLTRGDGRRGGGPELVALNLNGGATSLLLDEGLFPVYSPDGSKIALLRESERPTDGLLDLYVIDADGSHLRRLTNTPGSSEVFASWDPSGERLAYSRLAGGSFRPGATSSIMEINANGSCPTTILSMPHVGFYGPTWQPGPGREAGPIAC
jgi:Tol biopolymer transport system component